MQNPEHCKYTVYRLNEASTQRIAIQADSFFTDLTALQAGKSVPPTSKSPIKYFCKVKIAIFNITLPPGLICLNGV